MLQPAHDLPHEDDDQDHDQDLLRFDATKLHNVLDNYGIANTFEIYPGTHTSAVAARFQNHVLPFFSKNLCFTAECR